MAERLTEKCSFGSYVVKDYADKGDTIEKVKNHEIIDKLGKLEDILEKYDLEVEELDERIHNGAFNYIDKLKTEFDRDTWQKACELACKRICYMLDQEMQYHEHEKFNSKEYLKTEIDYFYQQAKKENESK